MVERSYLKKAVESRNMKYILQKNSCKTRWNTELENMKSVLNSKEAILDMCTSDEWDAITPNSHQWLLINETVYRNKAY